jgi:hypothetical protein
MMMLNTREHGYYDAIRGYKSICDRPAAYHEGYEAGTRARIGGQRVQAESSMAYSVSF